QLGEAPGGRGLDLAPVLPQLGRYPGQAHGGVDVRLLAAGDAIARGALDFSLRLLALGAEHAVLGDPQPLLDRPAPQLDVVLLRAGEVDEGGAVAFRRHHAQVHLETRAEDDGALGIPGIEDLVHLRIAAEALHDRDGPRGDGEQVDVADRLLASAVAAGHLQALQLGRLPQIAEERLDEAFYGGQKEAAAVLPVLRDASEDLLLALGAEAGNGGDEARLGRG